MADVHCQMCGKPNPAERETCQYCEARLKPLYLGDKPDDIPPAPVGDVPVPKKTAELESTLPDWLRSLRDGAVEESQTPEQAEPFNLEAMSDLTEGQTPAAPDQPVPDTGDSPDWLDRVRQRARLEDDLPEAEETPASSLEAGAEEDWLAGLRTAQSSDSSPQPPEWLQELSGSQPADKDQPSEPVPTPAGPGIDAGDWASSWDGESQASQADDDSPAQPGTLPDWLSGLTKEDDSLQQPAVSESDAGDRVTGTEQGEILRSEPEPGVEFPVTPVVPEIPAESSQVRLSNDAAIPGMETELPEWLKGQADQSGSDNTTIDPFKTDMPEWLSSRAGQPDEPGESDEELQEPATPDWLPSTPASRSLGGDQARDDGTATPFIDNKLPDWLQNLQPPEEIATPVDESSKPSHEQEANLTPGELPGWVQAMRPVESATPMQPVAPEVDQHMENIGPLAGIQGVLHAENILAGARRPQVYSAKLQVSEKQHTNASLLESMLSQATEPQQVKVEPARLSPRLLTAIVGIVLLLALWLPIGFNSQQMSLPAFVPAENLALSVAIEQLPENSPVLVAVDYDSGMVGEMEAVASSTIAHLMEKSANMVLISTNPMGQVLAERLIEKALTIRPEYPAAEKTANLGYLAGGAPALFDFAVDPNTMTRLLSGTTQGWTGELLAGPRALWNFAQVLVITDNADVSRAWIEQVQPQLGGKPMFIIASAQAAPMTSPYVDSGQIKGLVTGLVGGSIYEQLAGKPAFSRYYWDSYQAGLLFLIALIALGGMIGFGSAVANRQNNGV